MKTVLLAGGFGTRLSEETSVRPKPMIEIGGIPILVHVMRGYASYGHEDFIVACGFMGNAIKDYFARFHLHLADFTVDLAQGTTDLLGPPPVDWKVTLVDTGLHTMTGGRIARLKDHLTSTFMLTYGDGLADVDLDALLAFHKSHGKLATVTAVRPPARFGSLVLDADRQVTAFEEKVSSSETLINGGFFVLEPEVIDYIERDDQPFERAPLERLASDGQLSAYIHEGFWKPMDTLRDKRELEGLWETGDAPWATRWLAE